MEELEEKVKFLIETISRLEKRVNDLEKLVKDQNALSDSEFVTVTGAMNIPIISKVTLSENEILEIYNNNSDALLKSAVKVSLTQESLLNKNVIFLEKAKSKIANYWVIATEDDNYWLLPKGNLRINAYNYETVCRLFECDSYQSDINSEFIVVQLAKVTLTQNREQWQLLEAGKLEFISSNEYQSEEIHSLIREPENLDNSEQTKIPKEPDNNVLVSDVINQEENHREDEADLDSLLIKMYNTNGDALATLATVVMQTPFVTNEELSLITNDLPLFEKNMLGEYWLFSVKQMDVYLVPRRDRDVSQDIEKIQRFFECRDYNQTNSNEFQLIKPARVSPLNSTGIVGNSWVIKAKEKWQLQETGILQFVLTV